MDNSYEYTPLWYLSPCQVRWYNTKAKKWEGGIAYLDRIICGDGAVISNEIIVTEAARDGVAPDDAIVELEWIDLSDIIWH